MVQVLVDKVHRAASHFHAIVEGLLLRVEARKRRQQRGMNVENAIGKRRHKLRRKQPHVAGQADQVDPCAVRQAVTSASCSARLRPLETNTACGRPSSRAACDALGVGHIRDHDRDLNTLQAPARIDSAMARKFDPRPESRMPRPDAAIRHCVHVRFHWLDPAVRAHVYCTRRSPFTTRPMT